MGGEEEGEKKELGEEEGGVVEGEGEGGGERSTQATRPGKKVK